MNEEKRDDRKGREKRVTRWPGLALIGLLVWPGSVWADRYFTWVDEQGHLRTTIIKEENPLEKRAEEVREDHMETAPDEARHSEIAEEPAVEPASPDVPTAPAVSSSAVEPPVNPSPRNGLSKDEGSQRGKSDTGAPAAAQANGATAATREPEQSSRPATLADPVYNLANFPDGNELAAKGFIREGDPMPFYTWTDASGVTHNTAFNPIREQHLAEQREKARAAQEFQSGGKKGLTPATVARRNSGLPSGAAENAAIVLGLKDEASALLQAFSDSCCETLSKLHVAQLQVDRGNSIRIGPDAPVFDFATGTSPYRIIELPQRRQSFPMRLRSFVQDGVFMPTLVFLDDQWRPVRLVTDIDFQYQPETWYRYGYIEAVLPVEPRKDEQWLLVLSRQNDLGSYSRFNETEAGTPVILSHSDVGELELMLP